jgi:sensory rhodopsin
MAGEELIYYAGAAVFGLATIIFGIMNMRKEEPKFNVELFVSFFTSISYIIMALGYATVVAPNSELIYWSRWLFYIASCTLLTTDIAHIKGLSNSKIVEVGIYTGLTMFAGFLASYFTTIDKWWFFAFSSIAYLALLFELNRGQRDNMPQMSKILVFVTITWTLFPVVWVLAPTGLGLFNTFIEAILYLILDLTTKTAFGLYLYSKVK